MASASSLLFEEQLQCSICLGTFTEPVTTPCGHNYCKACIMGYWSSSNLTQCPLCKKRFRSRPQLQVNTEFRDMVVHFINMRVSGEEEFLAKPGEVACDICCGQKLKAQKTCMVCLASYCQSHLEPHQRVKTLKKHKLIEPVSNLEDRVCKKHDKMFELFCQTDQMCVCFMCLKDDHVTHTAVPLERVFKEKRAQLESVMSELKMMEETKVSSIIEMKCSIEQSKKESEKEIADIDKIFTTLVASLQRRQVELIELIQEKQKAVEKQAKHCVTQLEEEVGELKKKSTKVEKLLQTEDDLCHLQTWPSFHFPTLNKDLFFPAISPTPPFTQDLADGRQRSYVGKVKKAATQMEKAITDEMEMLIREVVLSDGCEGAEQAGAAEKTVTDEFIKEVWNPPQDKLMMIQQWDAVDVTLDASTANARLEVSEDGKQLSYHYGPLDVNPYYYRRFKYQPFVLGNYGFSSGKFYYEVRVSGSTGWLLGVAKESINKAMIGIPLNGDLGWILGGCWTGYRDEYFTSNYDSNPLYVRQRPDTVGVFVDYEGGEVSFYDVDARVVIWSYTGCDFTETTPLLKAFLYSLAGAPLDTNAKLYPLFGIFEGEFNMLEITSVGRHAT